MINLKQFSKMLIFALSLALSTSCFAAPTHASENLNALVINFAPPFLAGQNLSENLYSALLTTMQEKPSDLAGRVNAAGAIWSLNQNLSGVQFALYFPGDNHAAIEICRALLRNLATRIPTIRTSGPGNNFLRHLHSLCKYPEKEITPEFKPISVFACCKNANTAEILASETALLDALYTPDQSAPNPENFVVPGSPASAYEIFSWADFSLGSFLSARYLGEMFINELGTTASASYEILVSQYGLSLALLVSGNEEELFLARDKVRAFLKSVHGKKLTDSWSGYVNRALQILEDDNRDFRKKSLFDSWVKHWNGDFATSADLPEFVAPAVHSEGVSHPEHWHHEFSYSENVYPRFCACSLSETAATADIAITFSAGQTLIKALAESIESESASLFPLNQDQQTPTRLVISFHCPVDKISGNIARIRSRLTADLIEKGIVQDFQREIRVGISATCKIQPYELRGYLQQGWPTVDESHRWRQPDAAGISQALMFPSTDNEAVKRRWALATSTAKGKAIILSYFAAQNLMLKNFITH